MTKLFSSTPTKPYEDPLLYDKAKLVTICHFIDNNFITSAHTRSVDIIHCIRSRTADAADKLMLKRELFQLLPVATEYTVSSGLLGNGKSFVRIKHNEMLQEFIITKDGLSHAISTEDLQSGQVIESNFSITNLGRRQLIDELIQAFPYQDFSFLS